MKLFHGSRSIGLTNILPISVTGITGPTDGCRENFRDVVFMSTSLKQASIYAGPNGRVYTVSAPDAVSYRDTYLKTMAGKKPLSLLNKKIQSLPEHIYIAPSAIVVS